jgi:hypothetical protein
LETPDHENNTGYIEALDHLLQLRGITPLSINLTLDILEEDEGVNRLVAFVQLVKARLLANDDNLAIHSIRVRR